jgi:hypothetical protein
MMKTLLQISILVAGVAYGLSNLFFASAVDGDILSATDGAFSLAFALGAVAYANIPAEVIANIRRWHGTIDDQFNNIDNIFSLFTAHMTQWSVPQALMQQLTDNHSLLAVLIPKCRSNQGSAADRTLRNSLLKITVGLCLTQIRAWVYTQYYAGVMTLDDVHLLGFFVPGEGGGHRERTEASDVLAEVKVTVLNADFIRVVVDQASGENAALVVHGWPQGVHHTLIVIMAADAKTEVLRLHTSHMHNDIRMPDGSHGNQFLIKAAFLKHVDDEPRFGAEPTFSMPLTTEDLIHAIDRQDHENFEAQLRQVEQHRQEVEQLNVKIQ